MKTVITCVVTATLLLSSFVRAELKAKFPGSTVTVNGQAITDNTLVVNSQGALGVFTLNSPMVVRRPVSFRVSLRRAGAIVRQWPSGDLLPVYSVQLNELWPLARPGDELVIEPAGATDGRANRVIKLKPAELYINWLGNKSDGC